MKTRFVIGAALPLLLAVACASDTDMRPAKESATTVGTVLADSKGMTLYTFDRDTAPGKSACNGPCATNWPPLMVDSSLAASGNWSVITRDDGGKQWAYKGKPLYLWSKDQKPGDTTGEGFNNVWRVARP